MFRINSSIAALIIDNYTPRTRTLGNNFVTTIQKL